MDDDALNIEVAEYITRKFSRNNFDDFLIKKGLYSRSTLTNDPEYMGLRFKDHAMAVLQGSRGDRVILALYEAGKLSEDLVEQLREAGYELGEEDEVEPAIAEISDEKPVSIDKPSQAVGVLPTLERAQSGAIHRIAFFAADPSNQSRTRMMEQYREITDQLRKSRNREKVIIVATEMSVRPQDFSQALLDHKPNIVHFTGHGTINGEICFEDRDGRDLPVQPHTLAQLFSRFQNTVECVILNACFSARQASVISQHIPYVIGMSKSLNNTAATAFAVGFYQALGAGQTIEDAYELGKIQMSMHNPDNETIPILLKKGQPPVISEVVETSTPKAEAEQLQKIENKGKTEQENSPVGTIVFVPTVLSKEQRNQLFDLLRKSFSIQELKIICFVMGVDWDVIHHDTITTAAMSLIEYSERHAEINKLIEAIRQERPRIEMPQF